MEKEIGIARGMVTQKGNYFFFLYETGLGYYKCRAVGKVEWRVRYGLVFTSYRMAIILWIFYAKKFISVDKKKMEIKYGNMTNDIFMLLHSIISFRHFFVASDLQF